MLQLDYYKKSPINKGLKFRDSNLRPLYAEIRRIYAYLIYLYKKTKTEPLKSILEPQIE